MPRTDPAVQATFNKSGPFPFKAFQRLFQFLELQQHGRFDRVSRKSGHKVFNLLFQPTNLLFPRQCFLVLHWAHADASPAGLKLSALALLSIALLSIEAGYY